MSRFLFLILITPAVVFVFGGLILLALTNPPPVVVESPVVTVDAPIDVEVVNPFIFTHRCWDDAGVVVVRDGTQSLLPAPRTNLDDPHSWRHTTALVLRQETDDQFLIEYQFEKWIEVPIEVLCTEVFP